MIHLEKLINDHPLLLPINNALGRKVEFTAVEEQRGEWKDTEQISLPRFLSRTVRGQFATDKSFGGKDVLASNLIANPSLRLEFTVALAGIMDTLLSEWKADTSSINLNDESHFFRKMAYASNLAEITKQQLLIGAPVLGHPLSGEIGRAHV